MIRYLTMLAGVLALAPAGANEASQCNTAGNQLELNACALEEFTRADQELNEACVLTRERTARLRRILSEGRPAAG